MQKLAMLVACAGAIFLASTPLLFGQGTATPPADETPWPYLQQSPPSQSIVFVNIGLTCRF
jgi:hypothetical protein